MRVSVRVRVSVVSDTVSKLGRLQVSKLSNVWRGLARMKKVEDLQRSGSASVEQNEIGRWVEYRLPEQKHLCAMMHAPSLDCR